MPPRVWLAHAKGTPLQGRVCGPDLMERLLREEPPRGMRGIREAGELPANKVTKRQDKELAVCLHVPLPQAPRILGKTMCPFKTRIPHPQRRSLDVP